jgi:hypothetical protein
MKTKTEKFNKEYSARFFKDQNLNQFKPGDKIKVISNEPDDIFANFWGAGECFDNWEMGSIPELMNIGEVVEVRTFSFSWLPKNKKLVPIAIIEVEGKCYLVNEKCLEKY